MVIKVRNPLVKDFSLDEESLEILDRLHRTTGVPRSKIVRDAIKYYSEFKLDPDTLERIDRIAYHTKLPKKAVLAMSLKMLEEVML